MVGCLSSPGPKMPLAPARRLAEALVRELEPACERIEIAGSIRWGADHVGDLELLAIPRLEDREAPGQTSLFGPLSTERVSLLWEAVDGIGRDRILPIRGSGEVEADPLWPEKRLAGSKAWCLWLPRRRCRVDLFLCTRETWGAALALRTGSAEFSKALVTRWIDVSHGGHFEGLRLRRPNGAVLATPEERDVFAACRVEWRPPHLRRSAADLRAGR